MEIKKYILKKFDYDVDISNKKFYTLNETIKQKLGIDVRFLEDKKNIDLTFKIDMIDNKNINIFKLTVEYILTLNNEPLDISERFVKKILSKFYPIFSKFVLNFYNSIGLKNIQLPEFWAKEKGIQKMDTFFIFYLFPYYFCFFPKESFPIVFLNYIYHLLFFLLLSNNHWIIKISISLYILNKNREAQPPC